ncbi:DExH-box ATP-dependent RNA helicase DExH10 [Glycine max]|nr:DExH-box ATP-dependent RNA helicase DExH10 [Glycine max]
MDVRDSEIVELLNQVEELEKKLFAHPMHKKLGHTDADGVVQLRGRAACLIDTGDELLVIELMFNGESIFVSLLCFLYSLQFIIFEYLPKLLPLQIQLRTELARPLQQIQDSVRRIAEVGIFHIT